MILTFAGNKINEIANGQGKDILNSIAHFETVLKDFRSQFQDLEDKFDKHGNNYRSKIGFFDRVLGFILGVAILILICNVILMYKGIKGHKNNYKL